MINAGDGKHEHPSQALLDVFTLRRRLDGLDGKRIWIVGDVLHSRRRRSNLTRVHGDGAEVTVCGPLTLIPRGIEEHRAHGCPTRSTGSRRPTSSTPCARQRERMNGAASCLRSASTSPASRSTRGGWARGSCRCTGAGEPGRELSAEVIDSPQSLMPSRSPRSRGADGDLLRAPRQWRGPGPERHRRARRRAADASREPA